MLFVLLPGLGNQILGYSKSEGQLIEVALKSLEPDDSEKHIYPKAVRYGTTMVAIYCDNDLVYRIIGTNAEETSEHVGVSDHVHLEAKPWFSENICLKRRDLTVGRAKGACRN